MRVPLCRAHGFAPPRQPQTQAELDRRFANRQQFGSQRKSCDKPNVRLRDYSGFEKRSANRLVILGRNRCGTRRVTS
jgi:hypothetical protein